MLCENNRIEFKSEFNIIHKSSNSSKKLYLYNTMIRYSLIQYSVHYKNMQLYASSLAKSCIFFVALKNCITEECSGKCNCY